MIINNLPELDSRYLTSPIIQFFKYVENCDSFKDKEHSSFLMKVMDQYIMNGVRYDSDISNEIAKKFGWDFHLNENDLCNLRQLHAYLPYPKLNMDRFGKDYNNLKFELYQLVLLVDFQRAADEQFFNSDMERTLNFCWGFVGCNKNKYELWKIDRNDKQEAFRNIKKLSLIYPEIRENVFTDVRFWHYFFLFQFGLYYCVFEENNIIDYAVYKLGYEEVKEKIKHRDSLAIYFNKRISKRKPQNLDSSDKLKLNKSFEDFVVNKKESEEIFLLLDKIITYEKAFVFAKTLFDLRKSGKINIGERELTSFLNSFFQKKGTKPCSYEIVRRCLADLKKE